MTAMVAGEPVHQPVLDHPGGAVGALEAMPAGAAQRQRSEAAAIEEQQRLLARGEVGLELRDQAWRQPASARRRVLGQVDRADRRHFGEAMALGQPEFAIAADLDHVACFDGRSGRGEDDRNFLEMAAHHRDVAGVILDAFLLLEATVHAPRRRRSGRGWHRAGTGRSVRPPRPEHRRWRSRARHGGVATSEGPNAR